MAAHPTFKYLNKPWLRATGKRAYAMYMIHAPLSALLTYRLQSTMKRFPTWERLLIGLSYMVAMTFLSYGLAVVSDRLIESPINRFKRHFSY